jgi:hypothetical protein
VRELDLDWIAQGTQLILSLMQAFRKEFEQHTAGHVPPSGRWLIPKIVDHDEQEHQFYCDEKQM